MAELLLIGTVPNANPPTTAGAVLYAYGPTYGVGFQPLGYFRSTDTAPGGGGGRMVFRGLNVPVQWLAAATVQVTPIVDEEYAQPNTQRTYPTPPQLDTEFLQVPCAVDGTTIQAVVQILAASGPVRIGVNWTGMGQPRTGAFPGVVPGL